MSENRVIFLVDGFNVYHSAKEASADLGGTTTLWLDLHSLLSSYISVFGRDAVLSDIYYFSALAKHIDSKRPGTTKKHQDYIDCLRSTGIKIRLGRFKYKTIWCKACKTNNVHYEEKEMDVALSLKIMELFHLDSCDTVALVTGDTDLAPAVRMAADLFPEKSICFAFPYKRKNKELNAITNSSFLIRKQRYAAHQFADPYIGVAGRQISKPTTWLHCGLRSAALAARAFGASSLSRLLQGLSILLVWQEPRQLLAPVSLDGRRHLRS